MLFKTRIQISNYKYCFEKGKDDQEIYIDFNAMWM